MIRLPHFRTHHGGYALNRSNTIHFEFDGKQYRAFEGDTVASALIAEGHHLVGRSFKYHRPRGILGSGSDDPAGLVQIGSDPALRDPNVRATEQEVFDGLEVFSQNCWPSLRFDIGRINDYAFSKFLTAGFYYKTFMGPLWNWMMFEEGIRAAAGLGVSPEGPDPDRYEHINATCDILVAGGGLAGLMAAKYAADAGARVIICEETALFGGQLLSQTDDDALVDGKAPLDYVQEVVEELHAHENVTVLTRTCVSGYYANNFVTAWEKASDHIAPGARSDQSARQKLWRIRAKEVVLATGALERPLTFHLNDRPGILLAGAAQTYLHRYGVRVGQHAALFVTHDRAYEAAFDLHDAGSQIVAIVDLRANPGEAVTARAIEKGIPIFAGHSVVETKGDLRISGIGIMKLDAAGSVSGLVEHISCDTLLVSGGYTPNVALFAQSRGKLKFDASQNAFRPGQSWQNETSAGAANGTFGMVDGLKEGAAAGHMAAKRAGFTKRKAAVPKVKYTESPLGELFPGWEAPTHVASPRAWIDLQNDVLAKDLKLAVQEGYTSVEHAKRYTTTGMGTDQGKTVNMTAFGILSKALETTPERLGTTTFRQPYKPVTFGALAGQHSGDNFAPRRTTPMHKWHKERGAVFETVGDWLRPWMYPQADETPSETLMRETKATRTTAGVLDASTLGKIDIRGKDSRTFLNRIYTNAWSKLAPGKCRYGLMLAEDGMVFDDGVTSCIADDHFHMTTTSGGAARVLSHLEDYLQTEWPDLDVYLTSVTEQWAVASMSGPNAPTIIKALLGEGFDPEEFPFMSWKDAEYQGVPLRIYKISFTGEEAYEINIPARYGLWFWNELMAVGEPHGLTPYGTEAMHLLRAEKGFIIVGQDTDGTITPGDLRMDWIVSKKKGDFVGKRSLFRSDTVREDRHQLVGLLTEDPNKQLEEGAHIIETSYETPPPVPMLGHVTSSYTSPNLGRSIALALVKGGGKRMGQKLYATEFGGGTPIPVTIVETDFLANKGAAQ